MTAPPSAFARVFATIHKPVIAMAHLPPLPGTPLYDAAGGMAALVGAVQRDVAVLLDAGVDAILFCNEGDRPYTLHAGLEHAAAMTRVVTASAPDDRPFGVDFLWDPMCALAVATATGAQFMREVTTGVWESDMGLWQTDSAGLLRERRRLDADVAVLTNVTPEFASSIGTRTPTQLAASIAVSSIPDALLVSGSRAGSVPALSLVREIREAVPSELPVLLNTGASADTVAEYLKVADGCIVGSDLKEDGQTWNPVSSDRTKRFMDAARCAREAR